MKNKCIILSLLIATTLSLSACVFDKKHNLTIIEGLYHQQDSEILDIEIIEDRNYRMTSVDIEFKKITKEAYDELNGINTIEDFSKSVKKRSYFTILIYVIVDETNFILNVRDVKRFVPSKNNWYLMNFDFDLGDGRIGLIIDETHISIGFHPSSYYVNLILEKNIGYFNFIE